MDKQLDQTEMVFTTSAAWMGLFAYLTVIVIVAMVFIVG
jgi:hypothetical protein